MTDQERQEQIDIVTKGVTQGVVNGVLGVLCLLGILGLGVWLLSSMARGCQVMLGVEHG